MRLKPILIPGLLASALALPGLALAMGLGRLSVQSSLGQPLVARIELTSASKEELDSLSAKVAEPALYRQNNLMYQGVLSRSRVALERSTSGQAYLTVTTQSPVTEPYLDLMVELNWASGRIVREYTFLLDPPGVNAPPIEPTTPARVGAAPPIAAPAAPPRAGAPAAAAAPAAAPPSAAAAAAPAAAATPGAAQAPAAAQRAPAPRPAGAAGTYMVKRGDTLSRIAAEYKPSNVSLEQMLVATFKQNQAAFDGNNINRLRAGSILNIPSLNEAAATDPADASKVVRVHAEDWNAYRNRIASGVPQSDAGATRGSGGRIGTVEDKTAAAAPGRDQLRVSRAAEGGAGASAAEEAIARNKQIKEAQERIAELEKTVRELQRAAELKSQTLAMLQAQAEAAKGGAVKGAVAVPGSEPKVAETKAPETAKGSAPGVSDATKTAGQPAAPTKIAEVPKPVEAPKSDAAKSPDLPKDATTAAPPKVDEAVVAGAKSAPKAEEPPKAAPKAAKAEPSFFDDLMTGTPTWAIGAGALAVLGGIAALLAARRRKAAPYEDTITTDTDLRSNTVFGSTGGGVVNTGENSLSSEFSREGLGSIDTDEVDPIAEAEVYLAYGRDAQAEEILKDALKKDPQRQEIYLKLLEIHAQHNKPAAFDAVAAELHNVSHGQGEIWDRAVALGRQLDPANPFFAAAAAGAVQGSADKLTLGDTQRFSVPPQLTPSAAAVGDNEDDSILASGHADALELGHDLDFHLEPEMPSLARNAASAGVASVAAAHAGAAPRTDAAAPASLDKLDFALDENAVKFEDATPSPLDGQWHDSATKLDLAKAYQEMGDVEGAREILREVLAEGDDEQKTEARTLIAKLG